MKGVCLILCLMLARDIAGSIFRPRFDPRMANLVVQPLELQSDQQSIEQHQQKRHHHPRHHHVSAEGSRSEEGKDKSTDDDTSSYYRRLKAPIEAWNSALYSTVIGQADERQNLEDVMPWSSKPISEVSPFVANKNDYEKSSIFRDAFITMKHMTDDEKKQFHEAYQTAVQTSNEDVHLSAPQLLKKNHYEVEEHTVKTDDGYILTLFRIPAKKENGNKGKANKDQSRERSEETRREDSKEPRRDEINEQSNENSEESRKEKRNGYNKRHTSEDHKDKSEEDTREQRKEQSKEQRGEDSKEKSKEHYRQKRKAHSKKHSEEDSKEHSKEHSKENSKEKSKEHSKEDNKENSREHSREDSKEHSREDSKEHSKEENKEHSRNKRKEYSGEENEENNQERSSEEHKAPVVFLMHGLQGSADDWLLTGPGKALAYLLADAGYDVWLGNARGNKYSRRHVSKHPAQPDFWQFTTDEIALHDLPAMIDYTLNKTKQQKLVYVGHSQGTTAFFALASTRPEYNHKIKMMYAISPMVYMENARSPLLRMIADNYRINGGLGDYLLGKGEFNPSKTLTQMAGGNMCELEIGCKDVCSNVHFVMAGVNTEDVDVSRIPVIMGHLPAGTSIRQMKQYAQAVVSHEFRKYDYGADINKKMYGQREPPKYDVSKVKVPVALYYSEMDWFAHPKDVDRLRQELPNVKDDYKVPEKQFTHTDFQFSRKAPEVVFKRLIKSIKKNHERE